MQNLALSPYVIYSVCAALSGLYTFFWLKGNKAFFQASPRLKFTAILRFTSVFILLVLLFNPLLKTIEQNFQKPILAIAFDQSKSLKNHKDSLLIQQAFSDFQRVEKELTQKYDVQYVQFANQAGSLGELQWLGNQEVTNFEPLFNFIESTYNPSLLAGTVILSDGAFNKGVNPLYASPSLGSFVHSVLVEDTVPTKDVYLQAAQHNEIVFTGNQFALSLSVGTRFLTQSTVELKVLMNDSIVHTENLKFDEKTDFLSKELFLEAKGSGLQKIEVQVKSDFQEENTDNNTLVSFIDVVDNQSKVLLLAAAPHPDIFTIKSALEAKKQYVVETALSKDFTGSFDAYNLIISHNLPNSDGTLFEQLEKSEIPALFVLGAPTNWQELNKVSKNLQVLANKNASNQVGTFPVQDFGLFQLKSDDFSAFNRFPPLTAPFGEFGFNEKLTPLFNQRMGNLNSGIPLLAFGEKDKRKAWFFANGLWRWNMYEASLRKEQKATEELLVAIAQYLVLKEDKNRLKVEVKNAYWENESVKLSAELYNKSYALITTETVRLKLINEDQKEFIYEFTPGGDQYFLTLGMLEPGNYSYEVYANESDEKLSVSGELFVKELSLETAALPNDAKVMKELAQRNGGQVYRLNQIDQLVADLINQQNITQIVQTSTQFKSIISLKWLMFLCVFLLATEWFIRKRWGGQ